MARRGGLRLTGENQLAALKARHKNIATRELVLDDTGCAIPQADGLYPKDSGRRTDGWPVFEAMLRAHKLPAPRYEFRFDPERKWRFDMAWPAEKIALEVDGGIWSGGRHVRGDGFLRDCEKLNAAALAGWRILRYAPEKLAGAIDDLKVILR